MSDSRLTAPEQLELTPALLQTLLTGVSHEQMNWKPAPDRFSIAEVLAHLAHTERHAYRAKYEQFAAGDHAALEAYDPDAAIARGDYAGRDAKESLERFIDQRRDNLRFLRQLPAQYAQRTGQHSKAGAISLADLLNECCYHDLGHVRQLAELVRALKYYPHMGNYMQFYKVNP